MAYSESLIDTIDRLKRLENGEPFYSIYGYGPYGSTLCCEDRARIYKAERDPILVDPIWLESLNIFEKNTNYRDFVVYEATSTSVPIEITFTKAIALAPPLFHKVFIGSMTYWAANKFFISRGGIFTALRIYKKV